MKQTENAVDTAVTIMDVAKEAGVSYATVSRVVNNKGSINPDTRGKVLRAMSKLGYVANMQARSLAGGRSYVVGLLVHGLDTAYMGEIVRGIDEELANASYDLMLYTTHRRKTKESTYVAALTRGLADGLLLVLPRDPSAYNETLQQRKFPYVLIDHRGVEQDGPAVGATNWQGAYDATSYLVGLGHRRIGFITGRMDEGCAQDRLAGYKAVLEGNGLPIIPELIREGDFLQKSGYTCTTEMLLLPERPTAIFASNDISAFGAIEAIREFGLRVPHDISLIGFDDIPQASNMHPPLTTVRQPLEEMGRKATQMLLQRLANPEESMARVQLATTLIIRQSCQPPHTATDPVLVADGSPARGYSSDFRSSNL
jgi:LacI family transcriptional regulator